VQSLTYKVSNTTAIKEAVSFSVKKLSLYANVPPWPSGIWV